MQKQRSLANRYRFRPDQWRHFNENGRRHTDRLSKRFRQLQSNNRPDIHRNHEQFDQRHLEQRRRRAHANVQPTIVMNYVIKR
jgi:hypothetical protein